MTLQEIISFTNEHPICYFATVEGDQPRVRMLGFWFADESGFYFQTGATKEFPHQLKQNPKTEVLFYHKDNSMTGRSLRIEGEVEFLEDRDLKEKALNDRPFLKQFGLTADSPGLIIFRISHGKAHFWTMENNLLPKEYLHF
jgi:uncharacterized pyridoxamine 5'-phosphate oxidase family protein